MKFYKKPEDSRRYVEVEDHEVMKEASNILRTMGLDNQAAIVFGVGEALYAMSKNHYDRAVRTIDSQEKNPL